MIMTEEKHIAQIIIINHLNCHNNMGLDVAKKCAIVTVDHIISSNPHSNPLNTEAYSTMGFWQRVREEIKIYRPNFFN